MEDWENCSGEMKFEGEHLARGRKVIARMKQYLNENDSMKVEVAELELLLGPENSEVDLRHILRYARRIKERQRVLVTQ